MNIINNEWERLTDTYITEEIKFAPEHISDIKEFFDAPPDKRVTLIHSVRGVDAKEPEYIQEFLERAKKNGEKVYIPKLYNFQDDQTGGIHICNTMRFAIEQSGRVALGYSPSSEGSKFDLGLAFFNNKNIEILNPNEYMDDKLIQIIQQHNTIKSTTSFVPEYKGLPALNPYFKGEHTLRELILPVVKNLDKVDNNDTNSEYVLFDMKYDKKTGLNDEMTDANGNIILPKLSLETAIAFGMIYGSHKGFIITGNTLEDVKTQLLLEEKNHKNKQLIEMQKTLEKKNEYDESDVQLESIKPKVHKSYSKVALTLDKLYNPWRQ